MGIHARIFFITVGSLGVESWGMKVRLGGGHSGKSSSEGLWPSPHNLSVSPHLTVTPQETEGLNIPLPQGEERKEN